jgi:hypothetical protein
MNSFMARNVLDELLFMGKVGIYVDKAPRVNPADRKVPYLYVYKKEQIINWSYDAEGTLTNVLLAEHRYTIDEDTGLPNGVEEVTRQLRLWKGRGVEVTITGKKDGPGEPRLMPWTRLPFVILELQESLAKDIADYQIALMNMESSDIAYSLHSNFPFYTEQGAPGVADFMRPAASIMDATDNDATISSEAAAAKTKELRVGNTQGRMYAPEMDRPSFIAPPSDPLKVSMEKEAQIRERIMVQLHLTLTNLRPVRLSSDAKAQEFQGMEAGMFSIGYTLEQAENQIADIWSMYQGSKTVATVRYPTSYSQMSPDQRVEAAESLITLASKTPSIALRRHLHMQAAQILMAGVADQTDIDAVLDEIRSAKVLDVEPGTVRDNHEAGLVGTDLASKLLGYPAGEAEKAAKDHAERLARIAAAQSSGDSVSRLTDGSDPETRNQEKTDAQSADTNTDGQTARTRGDA